MRVSGNGRIAEPVAAGAKRAKPEVEKNRTILVLPLASPIGRLHLAATSRGLVRVELPGKGATTHLDVWLALHFPDCEHRQGISPLLKQAAGEFEEYFSSRRRRFSVPLHLMGTAFQTAVWREVATIPYGETRSYMDIARRIQRERAMRAVGAAQAANPLPIIVPCHRVIGSDGRLTGYAGGIGIKRWLLEHEAAQGTGKSSGRRPPSA